VLENRVWRKVFDPKREDVRGAVGWSKFHYEELHDVFSSRDIRVIKARYLRWAAVVTSSVHIHVP
jgi:hypothetical protein